MLHLSFVTGGRPTSEKFAHGMVLKVMIKCSYIVLVRKIVTTFEGSEHGSGGRLGYEEIEQTCSARDDRRGKGCGRRLSILSR